MSLCIHILFDNIPSMDMSLYCTYLQFGDILHTNVNKYILCILILLDNISLIDVLILYIFTVLDNKLKINIFTVLDHILKINVNRHILCIRIFFDVTYTIY